MSEQHGGGWACGTCATANASGNRFCVRCGTAHGGATPAGPPPTPAGFAPPPQPQAWPAPPPPTHPAAGTPAPYPPAGGPYGATPPPTHPGDVQAAPPPAPSGGPGTGRVVLIVAALALVAIVAGVGLGLALTRDGESADEVATEDGSTDEGTSTSVVPPPTIGDGPTSTVASASPTTSPPAPATAPTTAPATAPPVITTPPPSGGPFALGSWVAVRVSLRSQGEAEAFRNANVPEGTIIRTDDYPSLTPGFWIVAIGPFASSDAAVGRCFDLGITNRDDCFGAPLTSNPGDRDQRAYPD